MPEIVIEINGGANSEIADADTYTYKFRKNSRNFVTLICQPQYCTIKYHRNSADLPFEEVFFSKNVDSSTPNVNPQLRDAMRKLNILHILKYDCVLEMQKIKIIIDGNRSKTFDSSGHLRFPFYHTGIPKGPLGLYRLQKLEGLPDTPWNNSCVIRKVLDTAQSDTEKDFLFIAMYSYLAGKNQENGYNKFLYYWSAINAMGHYLSRIYNFFQDAEEPTWNEVVHNPTQDAVVLRALAYIINKDDEDFSSSNINDYIRKMEKNTDQMLRYKLKNTDRDCDSLSELYRAAYQYETGVDDRNLEQDENYQKILEFIDSQIKQKENIFTFFLLWYPYYWRNSFIHGNRTIPVFYTDSDVEIVVLKTINYFMENYIGTTLPHWFVLEDAMSSAADVNEIPEEIREELRNMRESLDKMVEVYGKGR